METPFKVLIFLKKKIVIFAMPKTGTTAVEAALGAKADLVFAGDPRNKHMTVRKFDRFVRPYLASLEYDALETVAVMREPVNWLASWYRYRTRDALMGQRNSTAGISFDAFCRDYTHADPPPRANVGRQARFLNAKDGALGVDRLFRYEDFGAFTRYLERRFGHSITLEQKNISPRMDLSLPSETEAQIKEYLADEYAIYNKIG